MDVKRKCERKRTGDTGLYASLLAVVLAWTAVPSSAGAEAVLYPTDAQKVITAAVFYHYQKNVRNRAVASVCYFDPKVEKSLRCSYSWWDHGGDTFRQSNRVKTWATKNCKKAGGKKCIEFWRNGRIRYKDLSPEQRERAESVLENIPSFDSAPEPLPEGVGVSSNLRERFEEVREYWDGVRKKRRGHNPHYALCASDGRAWASFYLQGTGVDAENVRRMCVLKCNALASFHSMEPNCHVVFEDGQFVNAAAEAALRQ